MIHIRIPEEPGNEAAHTLCIHADSLIPRLSQSSSAFPYCKGQKAGWSLGPRLHSSVGGEYRTFFLLIPLCQACWHRHKLSFSKGILAFLPCLPPSFWHTVRDQKLTLALKIEFQSHFLWEFYCNINTAGGVIGI